MKHLRSVFACTLFMASTVALASNNTVVVTACSAYVNAPKSTYKLDAWVLTHVRAYEKCMDRGFKNFKVYSTKWESGTKCMNSVVQCKR